MQDITSIFELKNTIKLLNQESQTIELQIKEQYNNTITFFQPSNIIEGNFKDIVSSKIIENFIISALGMTVGFVSKKIIEGSSSNIIKSIFGRMIQFGISNYIIQHSKDIKSAFMVVLKIVSRTKKTK